MRRPVLLGAFTLALALPAASAEAAVVVGISDQNASAWADPRLRALGLERARLIVPWDAATSEPARVQTWLDAVAAAGMEPHVAFEHLRTERCPSSPCAAPSRAAYAAAVKRFVARFPSVRTYTTWNEANHASQPVASRPETVAGYYSELVAACPACTVVSGDVVDSGSFVSWLRRFRNAASGDPQLWGLHNYSDVTWGGTSGTDAALGATSGDLWLEETGGIVVRRDAAGREILTSDEARAARAVDNAFAIAAARPRITRMYVYQWRAAVLDRFDAGLVRPDGATRPSYDALVRGIASLPAEPAIRWSVAWSATSPRRLVVRARCLAPGGRCSGRVSAVLRTRVNGRTQTHRFAARAYATSAAHRTRILRLRVGATLARRARRATSRTVALTAKPTAPAGAATTKLSLRLARP
jgi:hypothetical protein